MDKTMQSTQTKAKNDGHENGQLNTNNTNQ